jgi:UDPglucose 6-dehydrogenase
VALRWHGAHRGFVARRLPFGAMNVTTFGTGYVGLVSSACLADMGNRVLCFDIDETRIRHLSAGRIPIHEPGLAELVERNMRAWRLAFTSSAAEAVGFGPVQMVAVGTPGLDNGTVDLRQVQSVAQTLAEYMRDDKLIVLKSTVPVGTAQQVTSWIREQLAARGASCRVSVVSNPEFLKEGAAIEDFRRPDRVIVGCDDAQGLQTMRELYAPFLRRPEQLMCMDTRSAELTKYASNAMLATRISFMNELAGLAQALGADIDRVRLGIGSDPRIGTSFLYPGCGYGGSCLPKDVRALVQMAAALPGVSARLLDAVDSVNEAQKRVLPERIRQRFGADLTGRHFALWGLAFKPGTDDMRCAPSCTIIESLLGSGATVAAYDPVASAEARRVIGARPGLSFGGGAFEVLEGADALVIATEWQEFRSPSFDAVARRLRRPLIFDGRNLYDPRAMRQRGFEYHSIGRS